MKTEDKERIEKDSRIWGQFGHRAVDAYITAATAEHERMAEQLKQERSRVIDEVKAKGNELAKILRNADPVMFPTLVIRAEAIEDFCKTLTAHGEH